MSIQQLFAILRARTRIIFTTLFVVIAAALAASLLLPKTYTASASIVIDVKSPDPVAGLVLPALSMPGYMATQVDVINSDRVAHDAVKLLRLEQVPAMRESWMEATDGKGSIEAWLGDSLQRKLDVRPARESNVISINYSSPDPAFAAAAANAFAQSYIDTTIDMRVEPAKQYAAWFETQTKTTGARLEAAQARLSAYQKERGIVATDERLNYENTKLNELQTQLVLAEAQAADAQSKQKSGTPDTVQDVMLSPLVQQLKGLIATQEAKLQEMAGNLGTNHPQYQRAEAELNTLKQKLAAEIRNITASLNTSSRAGKEKVAELNAAIAEHKKRLLDLNVKNDEFVVLQREVDAAQKAYEATSQRSSQSSLESQQTQTNVYVLSRAVEPTTPSSPKVFRNLLLATFLGTLLAIGLGLIRELLDRRVRSESDLVEQLGIPLLGTIKAPLVHHKRSLLGRARPPRLLPGH